MTALRYVGRVEPVTYPFRGFVPQRSRSAGPSAGRSASAGQAAEISPAILQRLESDIASVVDEIAADHRSLAELIALDAPTPPRNDGGGA